jgi:hypothetical protein
MLNRSKLWVCLLKIKNDECSDKSSLIRVMFSKIQSSSRARVVADRYAWRP